MKFLVKRDTAVLIEDDTLVEKSEKEYSVEFEFDDSWRNFTTFAVFDNGYINVCSPLAGNRCPVPPECLERGGAKLRIGIYGSDGAERRDTIWCHTSRVLHKLVLDAGVFPEGTLTDDAYNKIVEAIGDLSAAGFGGKTLAEVLREVVDGSVCTTATDKEVEAVLNQVFAPKQ